MGAVQKISIALTPELAAEVEAAVQSGDYASTSEVIRAALRGWKKRRDEREAAIARLQEMLEEADRSGPSIPYSPELFDDIKRRGLERLAARKSE